MTNPLSGVSLADDGRTGVLTWTPTAEVTALVHAMQHAVQDGFARGLIRVEARVTPTDRPARQALHRSGFRQEGRLRDAAVDPQGAAHDVLLYARLLGDAVDGPEGFTAVMNTVTPRKRLIAHTLVTDGAGRVLLCETSFKPDWELPGGIVEPGESPRVACKRELAEELGVSFDVGRILVVDWLHPHLGWEDAVEIVFACPILAAADLAAIRPDGAEILAAHWLSLDEAAARVAPYAAGRLLAAWEALHANTTIYLEDGHHVVG